MKKLNAQNDSEAVFGRRIVSLLEESPVDTRQAQRLANARQAALAHARTKVQVRVGVMAGVGHWFERHPTRRNWLIAGFALMLGLLATMYMQNGIDDDDDDAHLLTDELPIDAYLSDRADELAKGR